LSQTLLARDRKTVTRRSRFPLLLSQVRRRRISVLGNALAACRICMRWARYRFRTPHRVVAFSVFPELVKTVWRRTQN
jgi:hypothetical protein